MKKWFFLMFLVLLSSFCSATVVNKNIANVSNCFNMTIEANLLSGTDMPVSGFDGCSSVDNNLFFCNCYRSDGSPFVVMLQTDNSILREPKEYDVRLKMNLFGMVKRTSDVRVDDWGDYVDVGDHNTSDLGLKPRQVSEYVFVNDTKIIYQNVTEIKVVTNEKIVYVNQTIENTSRIELLNSDLENYKKALNDSQNQLLNSSVDNIRLKNENKFDWFMSIAPLILGIIIGFFISYKFKKKPIISTTTSN